MVRKQIYIEERQEALLKRLSQRMGISEAELIRRGIDQCAQAEVKRQRRLKAWEEMKDFILRERVAQEPVKEAPRTWKREDLYDRWDRHHGTQDSD